MFPSIVDLNDIERDVILAESINIVEDDFWRDIGVVVVPACPSSQRRSSRPEEVEEVEVARECLGVCTASGIDIIQYIGSGRRDAAAFFLKCDSAC